MSGCHCQSVSTGSLHELFVSILTVCNRHASSLRHLRSYCMRDLGMMSTTMMDII